MVGLSTLFLESLFESLTLWHILKCNDFKKKQKQKKPTSLPFLFIILVWFRCVIEAQTGRAKSNKILLSPQPDKPVQDKEDEKAEEQHVAQQFGLTAPGQLLDSADGGTKQAARGVKVCVLK